MEKENTTFEVKMRDPISRVGFAMMEHVVTLDNRIGDGAYRTYALIKKYAMQKPKAWPSGVTLAKLRNRERRTIYKHFAELEDAGYIEREYRPGKQSILWLNNLSTIGSLVEIAQNIAPYVGKTSEPVTSKAQVAVTSIRHEEEESNNNKPLHNTEEDDGYVEEHEYVHPDDVFEVDEPRGQEKWRTNYGKDVHGSVAILLDLFRVCGKTSKKFTTSQESKDWRSIARIAYSLAAGEDYNGSTNVYPVEWIEAIVAWVATKNTKRRGTIKFTSALSAIMNVERRDEFVEKWMYHAREDGDEEKVHINELGAIVYAEE